MEFKDYYAILGVERDATADDIKKAFRRAARRYHPDVSRERDAEARMKDVNEAYAVLSDPEKRAAYDQLGQGWQGGQEFRPPPGWSSGFEFSGAWPGGGAADFSDFFAELFGRATGRAGGGHGRAAHVPGEDHHARIQIDLADAYRGAARQVTLRVPSLDAHGRMQIATRTLNVQIPQGIAEGQMMRLAGQGAAAPGGGPAGDLLLEVQFRPDPRFRVDGRDVLATLNVAPWEAALGAVIPVRLPDGAELKVRIPEGAQSGRQLRVRGKGIPGQPPGDLLLDVRVVLPSAGSARARELYETMARELAFDPRAEG